VEPPAETPALARIATHLRRGDVLPPQERQEGFDVTAILAAVREVAGVRGASLRTTPTGAHSLRLDLADGADPAEVSRLVARLLQDRMGLDAALQAPTAGGYLPPRSVPAPSVSAPPVQGSAAQASAGAPAQSAPVQTSPARSAPVGSRQAESQAGQAPASHTSVPTQQTPTGRTSNSPAPGPQAPGSQSPGTPSAGTTDPSDLPRRTPPAGSGGGSAVQQRTVPPAGRGRAAVDELAHRGAAEASTAAPAPAADRSGAAVEPVPARPLIPGDRPGPRVVIENVQVNTFGLEATVEVRLTAGEQVASGTATGPAVDGYLLRLCAMATASAIDELLALSDHADGPARCFVEHAASVPFGASEVAVVVLLLSCGGWVEQLAGSSVVIGDDRHAMVRATLAAVNRRLEALLS
jgi:hypothetical protein